MSISRVSTLQTSTTMLDYIMNSESNYNKLTEEAASGIKVNKPSDDPVATKKILNMTSEMATLEGYASNIKTAKSELGIVDSALASVTDQVVDASDYATQAANGTYTEDDLLNIKSQIDSIIDSVVTMANTEYNGKYVFSGTATSTQTYSVATSTDANGNKVYTDISYNGTATDDYERYVTISDGVSVAVNARGNDVFGSYSTAAPVSTPTIPGDIAGTVVTRNADGSTTVVTTAIDAATSTTTRTTSTATGLLGELVVLSDSLSRGDTTTISSSIDRLSGNLDTVTTTRTQLAAVTNKFKMTTDSIEDTIINLKDYKSNLQEADLTETLTKLANAKNALEATYTVTSNLLSSTTLLDYM